MWQKAGIWKLQRIPRGPRRETCPLCLGEEDVRTYIKIFRNEKWTADVV